MQDKKGCKNLRIKKVSIIGVIPSFAFQRAKYCALELHRKLPQRFPQPEIIGLLELDWSEKLQQWRQTLGREYWCLRRPVAVFFDEKFIGSDLELIKLTTIGNILIENIPRKNTGFIKESFRRDYISYLKKTKRIYCYLDICVDDIYVGTLTFELYNDIVPRTCENFKTLCLGTRGPLLSYKGSRIHRIVKEGWLQGGDIQYKTGGGGFSIFCDPLVDECFGISHNRRGVLSMANDGRHTNGSQFFITLKPSVWMDTHFVAFGQLIEGSYVLKKLENVDTMYECPLKKVEIKNCGKLDLGDVEDVDATYKEEPIPKKEKRRIETISEQVIRLVMEAVTDALARKEYSPDVLDEGDVASKMNIQLYFQGFYSLPESIFEESALYLRSLRRQLLRDIKPSATEVVEVIMYDLLVAVLSRMTTLDDVRETIGHDLYNKMISGINMKYECRKAYVKRMVDQITSTAESMVNLIMKKIQMMKRKSTNLKKFKEQMDDWIESFVLQETFVSDEYFIAERVGYSVPKKKEKWPKSPKMPKREGKNCCDEDRKKREEEYLAKLKAKYPPEDICCLGSTLKLEESEVNVSDFFIGCRSDSKSDEFRMPLLDLIEMSRFNLRWLRRQERRSKSDERLCLEKKIRKWMAEVEYTSETCWLRDAVFEKDAIAIDHVEEIMYGAMTAGLLEMYYFMEEYLKKCGKQEKEVKTVTRVIYPEDDHDSDEEEEGKKQTRSNADKKTRASGDTSAESGSESKKGSTVVSKSHSEEEIKRPCTCGHPCCKCEFDPFYKSRMSSYKTQSEEGEKESVGERDQEEDEEKIQTEEGTEEGRDDKFEDLEVKEVRPCASDETLIDIKQLMAESVTFKPEEIDIKSLKWLRTYIIEKSCDLKTDFATQVHKWLEGERFNYQGFISNHSLPTRNSLLSLSFSLAQIIMEGNNLKTEIKHFIYDLWDLYFEEMFKEAILQNPPRREVFSEEKEIVEEEVGGSEVDEGSETDEDSYGTRKSSKKSEKSKEVRISEDTEDLICKQILAQTPDIDLTEYCAKLSQEMDEEQNHGEKVFFSRKKKQITAGEESSVQSSTHVSPSPSPPPSSKEVGDGPQAVVEKELMSQQNVAEEEELVAKEESTEDTEFVPDPSLPPPSQTARSSSIAPPPSPRPPPSPLPPQSLGSPSSVSASKSKKRKSPVFVEELVEVSSSEEVRVGTEYSLPFWVKFLTELTKQALAGIAKVSRLPRRLYFQSETDLTFDEKMKEWMEFNTFNPQPTKGREIMDFIAVHHKSLENLDETARSFLKKKRYSNLIDGCTRIGSADDMAEEIISDLIANVLEKAEVQPMDAVVSSIVSAAVASIPFDAEATETDDERKTEHSYDTLEVGTDEMD